MQHQHSWKHSLLLLAVLAAPTALNQMFKEPHHPHAYRSIAADDSATSSDTISTVSAVSADTHSTVQAASADTQSTVQAAEVKPAAASADTQSTLNAADVKPAVADSAVKPSKPEEHRSSDRRDHDQARSDRDQRRPHRDRVGANCRAPRVNSDLVRLENQNGQMLQIMQSMVQLVTAMVQGQNQQRLMGSYFDNQFPGMSNSPQMPSWSNVFPSMWGWNTGLNQNFAQGFNPNFSQGFPLSGQQQSSPFFSQPSSVVNNYYYGSGQAQMGLMGQSPLLNAASMNQQQYAPLVQGQNGFDFSGVGNSATPQFGNFRALGSI